MSEDKDINAVKGKQEIKCICGRKDSIEIDLGYNEPAQDMEWICPDCGAKKTIIIHRRKEEIF